MRHAAADGQDSGLAVRKRVIKLLRGIYGTTSERDIMVDICCKMVGLTADLDENIKVSCEPGRRYAQS
jgi:cohesin loading factor subunit SCC2